MRLFVTGAGGFLGAAIVRAAVADGHAVTASLRPGGSRTRLAGVDAAVAALDLRDTAAVMSAVRDARPDAIVHAAWAGVSNAARDQRAQITDNIAAACALLDAAVAAGAGKFVGIGSQGEYGARDGPITEQSLPAPTTLYGAAKLAALHLTRQLAAQAGIAHAWVRLFASYGPGDNPQWLIPSMIETLLSGTRPKTTLGTQTVDCLYVDDAAAGIVAAAVTPAAIGVMNLASGRPVTVRHVVETIRDRAAPGMDLVFGEIPFRPDQVFSMDADVARLRALTGWTPRITLADGLARTVAWHQNRHQDRHQDRHQSGHQSGDRDAR